MLRHLGELLQVPQQLLLLLLLQGAMAELLTWREVP
jgi:hypothetical protein